jgi:hypothetical protein
LVACLKLERKPFMQPMIARLGSFRRRIVPFMLAVALSAGPAVAHTAIQGHVMDASGNPVGGAWVYAYDSKNNIIYGLSDDGGFYDLTVLPGGPWSVTALAPGFRNGTGVVANALADTHNHGPEFKLEAAPPFRIRWAAAPIPLSAGIDAPEFADAAEIRIDQPYHVVVGLERRDAWKGPQMVSGRFKVMWDDRALYYAGDVIWAAPGLNSHTDAEVWNGNGVDFFIQTAPFDRNRTEYHPDQNWHLALGAGVTPSWYLFGAVNARPSLPLEPQFSWMARPGGNGILFRLNVPWSMLPRSGGAGTMPPAVDSLGALGIAINAADPGSDPANTQRQLQLAWPMSDTNYTDPSYLQPAIFAGWP